MNYQHAFHAGNFADCFKHALLVAIVDMLGRKPTGFCVLDTHAGAGQYDLMSDAARRSGEADGGIRRLLATRPPRLLHYLDLVEKEGLYPGSPVLMRALLRENDRLVCCESQPEIVRQLRQVLGGDKRVHIHRRSGWEALTALLPPAEKRGLVLIDPPFEDRAEFEALASGLVRANARFPHGVLAGWYPIKRVAAVREFHAAIAGTGIRDVIAVEMVLRTPTDAMRLNGCGLLVVNPPFGFPDEAALLAQAVLDAVGTGEDGANVRLVRLTHE